MFYAEHHTESAIQEFKQQIIFIFPLWEDDSGSGIAHWFSHKIVSHVFVNNRNPNL